MISNPDVSKQAPWVVKETTNIHVTVYFNNISVIRENFQKHLGLILDSKLNFFDHINEKTSLNVSTLSGKRTCCYHGLPF